MTSDPVSAPEVADKIGHDPRSTAGALSTLVSLGYVERVPGAKPNEMRYRRARTHHWVFKVPPPKSIPRVLAERVWI